MDIDYMDLNKANVVPKGVPVKKWIMTDDDSPTVRQVLHLSLKNAGYSVKTSRPDHLLAVVRLGPV